jgi:crotonobetainyl-CoA:carnitine CoA-transferase CaiB-like acyl-CoA transferase
VVADAHLRARAFLGEVERVDRSGTFTSAATPWLIDEQRPHSLRRPPTLGEDNAYVFMSILGLDPAEYEQFVQQQVIY